MAAAKSTASAASVPALPASQAAAHPAIKVLDFAKLIGTKLSAYQAVLLKATRPDQYPTVTAEELAIFTSATGRTTWPSTRPWLTVCIAGIRSGKGDRIAKPLALYEALYGGHAAHAAPGETVCVPIVAQDFKASAIVLNYIKASLRKIGTGFSVVTDDLVETVRLSNGLEFRRFPPSPTALRGVAAPFFVLDEAAHLPREGSANADVDLFDVLRGRQISFSNPAGLIITSPWDKSGLVYDLFVKHWGDQGDPDVLVWRCATWLMNPAAKIERERRLLSPAVFGREIGAEFADSIEGFLSTGMLQAATDTGITERLPQRRQHYFGAVDTSGGKHDTFTVAVAHLDGGRIILDKVTGWTAADFKRLRTRGVVTACAELVRRYGITTVVGDRYAGSTFPDLFAEAGIVYRTPVSNVRERGVVRAVHADRTAIYSMFEEVLTDGRVRLVDHAVMFRQFQRLERRYSHDAATIDHPSSGSDDYANAAALAIFVAEGKLSRQARQAREDDEDSRPASQVWGEEEDSVYDSSLKELLEWARPLGLVDAVTCARLDDGPPLDERERDHVRAQIVDVRVKVDPAWTWRLRMERAELI